MELAGPARDSACLSHQGCGETQPGDMQPVGEKLFCQAASRHRVLTVKGQSVGFRQLGWLCHASSTAPKASSRRF